MTISLYRNQTLASVKHFETQFACLVGNHMREEKTASVLVPPNH